MDDPEIERRAMLAEIDRRLDEAGKMRAETEKYVEESHKLRAEHYKLWAESRKLESEAGKLERDRLLAPVIAIGGLVVAALAIMLKH